MKPWTTLVAFIALIITQPLAARTFKTEQWHTSNGAKVVLYQALEVPMLDISIAFAAGSAYDGQRYGLSALTAELLDQGAGNLNANQIAEKFADIGAQFSSESSKDMVMLQLKTLTSTEALQQAMDTFSLIINKPWFRQEAFNREKNRQLISITQIEESPENLANLTFFNKLYQNHPYAHAVNGTIETVKAIRPYHVKEFYQRYYVSSNAVIVMVGAIDSEKAHQLAEQLTEKLPKGQPAPPIPEAKPLENPERVDINFSSSQTMLRLGQVGITHADPNFFPLMVGNYILGGGALVSQLSQEVRGKRGLTYGITSQFMPMPANGPFLISFSTKNNQAVEALQVTEKTLTDFLAKGPTEEELIAAKQYMVGSFPLSLASNSSIAGMLLRIAFYHLPDDYLNTYTAHIEAVTADEIKQAFDLVIHLNKMLIVSVGKQ